MDQGGRKGIVGGEEGGSAVCKTLSKFSMFFSNHCINQHTVDHNEVIICIKKNTNIVKSNRDYRRGGGRNVGISATDYKT